MQNDGRGKSAPSKKQKATSELLESKEYTVSSNKSVLSIADELRKLVKLKQEGILKEFQRLKQDLIRKNK